MAESLEGRRRSQQWKKEAPLIAVLAAVFFVMLAFTAMTPLLSDDFSYCFSWADNSRIRSLRQIVESMAVHWEETNGRVFVHGVVQFLLMLPKTVFNLCNALVTVLLCVLALRSFRGGTPLQSALVLLCGIFMVWNYLPAFGQVFFWLDGSVNYSWGICAFFLFLQPFISLYLGDKSEKRRSPVSLLLIPLSFFAGCYSESSSICVVFAALCLAALSFFRTRRLDVLSTLCLAAACLGVAFLFLSPAMRSRAGDLSELPASIRTLFSQTKELLGGLYCIYAVCLALCLVFCSDRRKPVLSLILVISGAASLAALAFARYFADRHLCYAVLITVLACQICLSELLQTGRKAFPAALAGVMAVLFIFNFILGGLDIAVVFKKSLDREQAIREAIIQDQQELVLDIYVPFTKYSAAMGLEDLSPYVGAWPNDSIALYYGLHGLRGVEPHG